MSSGRFNLNFRGSVPHESSNPFDSSSYVLSLDSQLPPAEALVGYGIPRATHPIATLELIFGRLLKGVTSIDDLPFDAEPILVPTGRRRLRNQDGQSSVSRSEAQTSGTRSRFQWNNWMTTCLLEAKREEWDEYESQPSRKQMVLANVKWMRIVEVLHFHKVYVDAMQARNKWESMLGSYKKIKDHQHKSDNLAYECMSRSDRKAADLPVEFLPEWINLFESFYGRNATVHPSCMAEGYETKPSDEDVPNETPTGDLESEPAVYSKCTTRSNSGKWKKTDTSKKPAIANCISNLSDKFIEVEDRKQSWLEENSKIVNETEREKIETEKQKIAARNSRNDSLVAALSQMAKSLDKIAENMPRRGAE